MLRLLRASTVLMVIALVFAWPVELWACPMCAESLAGESVAADGTPQPNLPKAFMWSILFMLGMPAAVLGTLGGLVVRAVRAADAAHDFNPASDVSAPVDRPRASLPPFDAMAGETAIGVSSV